MPMTTPDVHSPHAAWYLLQTKPRHEDIALVNLERQGYRCYLPRTKAEKLRRGKTCLIHTPLFARYLFIHLDSSLAGKGWGEIRSTKGVSKLVSFGQSPAIAADSSIGHS